MRHELTMGDVVASNGKSRATWGCTCRKWRDGMAGANDPYTLERIAQTRWWKHLEEVTPTRKSQ